VWACRVPAAQSASGRVSVSSGMNFLETQTQIVSLVWTGHSPTLAGTIDHG
jgi:hypothetical protein